MGAIGLLLLLGAAAAAATLLGGSLALAAGRTFHLVLGFSAGAVVAVALLDLAPEAVALTGAAGPMLILMVIGFVAYLIADRLLAGRGGQRGHLAAGGFTLHSLMDGLAIGLAFQVSAAAAAIVAAGVIAHDLADGVNTVTSAKSGGASGQAARGWLIADAAAPLAGILLGRLIQLPAHTVGALLALFAGAFLCIGASELIPASRSRHPGLSTTFATVAGAVFVGLAVALAGLAPSR
jgi:ZIP family zinc transporter